jgi:hypothetical protein
MSLEKLFCRNIWSSAHCDGFDRFSKLKNNYKDFCSNQEFKLAKLVKNGLKLDPLMIKLKIRA